jgi:hypothetical protein
MAEETKKIVPLNLTARLAFQVPGNPSITRPEDVVANCYPGLEVDVRNLDRRFFPGLVFEFIARNDLRADYAQPMHYGARVAYVDVDEDPDLQVDTPEAVDMYRECGIDLTRAQVLRDKLGGTVGALLGDGAWYLDTIEQRGKRLRMYRETEGKPDQPLDGLFVWRLVRSLETGNVTIRLKRRDKPGEIELNGWRRVYTSSTTGVINGAYQPGEMLQSLCSPWQHDFRDCYCHYWASNHPDIVYGAAYPGESVPPTGGLDESQSDLPLDWLRADRSRASAAGAFESYGKNRPYQLDHYQINREWQDLNVVIGDTEITGPYVPESAEYANPYADPAELAQAIHDELAPLELTLAIEYLYSRFSLLNPSEARRTAFETLSDDVTFARHYMMLIATSEMQHVRWTNELMWDLYDARLVKTYEPVFEVAQRVPRRRGYSPPLLRRLEPDVVDDYIAVEHPSGLVSGRYARVVATLRDTTTYPSHMVDLALRIANDGTQHERSFMDIQMAFRGYEGNNKSPYPYLREIREVSPSQATPALKKLAEIIDCLKEAYADGARGDFAGVGRRVVDARAAMNDLLQIGEEMAERGWGIPFWAYWRR